MFRSLLSALQRYLYNHYCPSQITGQNQTLQQTTDVLGAPIKTLLAFIHIKRYVNRRARVLMKVFL